MKAVNGPRPADPDSTVQISGGYRWFAIIHEHATHRFLLFNESLVVLVVFKAYPEAANNLHFRNMRISTSRINQIPNTSLDIYSRWYFYIINLIGITCFIRTETETYTIYQGGNTEV